MAILPQEEAEFSFGRLSFAAPGPPEQVRGDSFCGELGLRPLTTPGLCLTAFLEGPGAGLALG